MPEVSGYGPATSVMLQKSENSAPSATTRAVILSSQEARADLERYQELNRPIQNIGKLELSELEQRALDDVKLEQRNSMASQDQPEPSELSERGQRSLDALL